MTKDTIKTIMALPCVLEEPDENGKKISSTRIDSPIVQLDSLSVKEPLLSKDKKEIYDCIRLFFNKTLSNADIENSIHTFFERASHHVHPRNGVAFQNLNTTKGNIRFQSMVRQLFSSYKSKCWRVKELGSFFLIEMNETIKTNTFNFDAFSGYENIKIILNDNYLTVFQAKKLVIDEPTAKILYHHISYLILSKREPVLYGSNNIVSHFCKILGCNFYEYVEDGIIVI
jgi:hypothetical protein